MSDRLKKLSIENQIALKVMQITSIAEIGSDAAINMDSDIDKAALAALFDSIYDLSDWIQEQLDEHKFRPTKDVGGAA